MFATHDHVVLIVDYVVSSYEKIQYFTDFCDVLIKAIVDYIYLFM